jgi:hypothetical protein
MDEFDFVIIVFVLGIIFLFALFLSALERYKKFFNIISWITAVVIILLVVYYFFFH